LRLDYCKGAWGHFLAGILLVLGLWCSKWKHLFFGCGEWISYSAAAQILFGCPLQDGLCLQKLPPILESSFPASSYFPQRYIVVQHPMSW